MPASAGHRVSHPSPNWARRSTPSRSPAGRHEWHDSLRLPRVPPSNAWRAAGRRLVNRRAFADHALRADDRTGRRQRPPLDDCQDRFCLDGQRLVDVEPDQLLDAERGVPHGDRVLRTDPRGARLPRSTARRYFTVETADGRIHEYGATNDRASTARRDRRRMAPAPGRSTASATAPATSSIIATPRSGRPAFRIASIRYNSNPANGTSQHHTRSHSSTRTGPTRRSTRASWRRWHCGRSCASSASTSATRARCCAATSSPMSPCSHPAAAAASRRSASAARAEATALRRQASSGRTAQTVSPMSRRFRAPCLRAITCRARPGWNYTDINGDGRQDFLWAGGTDVATSTVRFRLGLGDGAFGSGRQHRHRGPSRHRHPFDANGDGRKDS